MLYSYLFTPNHAKGRGPSLFRKAFNHLFSPEYLVKKDTRLGDLPGTRETYQNVMRIALPSIAEMVLMGLIGSVDTMMVGGLGKGALAAVNLPMQPRMLLLCIFFALNVGVTAIVARRRGENERESANATLRNAIMLAILLSAALMSLAIVFAEPLMRLAGGTSDTEEDAKVLRDAVDYFVILAYALPVNAVSMCVCAAQRGIGNTKITLRVNIASNLCNVVLNYLLIGGNLGFPRLEVRGAALASALGMCVGMVLALITVFFPKKDTGFLHISFRDRWKFDREAMRSIIKVGGNAMIEQLGMRFGFFVSSRLVFGLGTTLVASHVICSQLLGITFYFGDGLSVAATSLVGRNMGAKRSDLSMLYGKAAQRIALVISAVLGILIILLRYPLSALFIGADTPDAALVVQYAAMTMLVIAAVQPFQTSAVVISGCLRGAGDNLYVALVATIAISVIRPAMTWLAIEGLHFGLTGTYIFMMLEIVIRLAFFYPRFASGKWRKIRI